MFLFVVFVSHIKTLNKYYNNNSLHELKCVESVEAKVNSIAHSYDTVA